MVLLFLFLLLSPIFSFCFRVFRFSCLFFDLFFHFFFNFLLGVPTCPYLKSMRFGIHTRKEIDSANMLLQHLALSFGLWIFDSWLDFLCSSASFLSHGTCCFVVSVAPAAEQTPPRTLRQYCVGLSRSPSWLCESQGKDMPPRHCRAYALPGAPFRSATLVPSVSLSPGGCLCALLVGQDL